jgi:hypothetical protein
VFFMIFLSSWYRRKFTWFGTRNLIC